MTPFLHISPRVRAALDAGRAVVALESTAIAHGLPWPHNLETAQGMQAAVRAGGAEPAVIALTGGRIVIGLEDADIERFTRAGAIDKASRRDLPVLLARGGDGATTVAGTMACARLAGIEVFATGGIGGVHRDVLESHDVSADLHELGRTRMAVVCSGAKSILDLRRTLEVLETAGVPVIGWRTDAFPGFHVRDSGLPVDARVNTPEQAAHMILANRGLNGAGVLIVNPVPEAVAIDNATVEEWIGRALAEARTRGIAGKAVTPFLLERLEEISGGRSLAANTALLVENARVAADIAVALARLSLR